MPEDLTGEIQNTPSHDVNADSSPAPEVTETGNPVTETSATETPDEPKKVNKVQARINQLTREKHEERQKNADLEKRLAALESKPAETKETPLVAPKEDDFTDLSDFETARSQHIADTAAQTAYDRLKAENNSRDDQARQTTRQQELQTKQAAFNKSLDEKREHFENFEEVAYGHAFMDTDLAEQIFDTEKGPELAYHLGSHLDVAEKIFSLPPVQRARELTKLEFSLEALKPKVVSDAPDPITPLGGSDKVNKSQEEMTDAEWLSWRNNDINARNNHG